ncbi:MAG: hypothetical protein JO288_21950 [Hyphomicrobiales bacterium]|nr:hypothetical protein [Hyphomicrobiales bacterium]
MKKGAQEAKGGEQEQQAEGPGLAEYQAERQREFEAVLAKRDEGSADAPAIVEEFAALWLPHHLVETEILFPALEEAGADEEGMAAVEVRKDLLNLLLADLIQSEADEFVKAKLEALSDAFDAVATAMSAARESVSETESSGERMSALGSKLSDRYERLKKRFESFQNDVGEAMELLAPRSLSARFPRRQRRKESDMARYARTPDRDEQGRFLPEDDREGSRGGYRGREREGGRFRQERDEGGRFNRESRQSRSRYEDEEEDYGRSMSRGRGYDEDEDYGRRSQSRGRGYDQDEGYGQRSMSRGREYDEDEDYGRRSMSPGRDYDEDERHSRRGEGRGHGGWFGDPEGHSEAARRGWEHGHEGNYRARSSRYDEDDRRYESRRSSRYEDEDDERGSRGRDRGHGGWSGDPEGHSQAARKGWEHRR